MVRLCDICGKREATLRDRIVESGTAFEFAYCEPCYNSALKSGKSPADEAKFRLSRRGRECPDCGMTIEEERKTLLFGCPDCYRNMRDAAMQEVLRTQGNAPAFYVNELDTDFSEAQEGGGYKVAEDCSLYDLVKDNVVSSRVRLARNVEGTPFPSGSDMTALNADIVRGAMRAADGMFDARIFYMSELSQNSKNVLIERHYISERLADSACGAVLIEDGENPEMSVMINEEDVFREQCLKNGHNLGAAYDRLAKYDERLNEILPLAYDKNFGYLTACPTNVGTGMRVSEMLFLPALKRAGAIDEALATFKKHYGLTIRGCFGEGSTAAFDMYQISNSRTFGVSPELVIRQVEQAAVRLCYFERVALEKLICADRNKFFNAVFRSYGLLLSSYSLTAAELMRYAVDVKIGIILGVLPIKRMQPLNKIIEECTSSLEIVAADKTADERDRSRARIAQKILAEEL